MSPKKDTQKSAKSATAINKQSKGSTDEERAAVKERGQELKAEARRGPRADKADGEGAVLAKIAEMPEPDRAMAKRLPCRRQSQRAGPLAENVVRDARVCQGRQARLLLPKRAQVQIGYATVGCGDEANLDEGAMWATSFALKELTAVEEAKDRQAREESGELTD